MLVWNDMLVCTNVLAWSSRRASGASDRPRGISAASWFMLFLQTLPKQNPTRSVRHMDCA
eukprot:213761-Chlamydomonas_euryale.AAC.4